MLRLRTFGGLTLEKEGVRLDEIVAQRKVLALLAVLARAGDQGIGRERLMALLWADSDMERARGSLKQMVHSLRRQLDRDVIVGTSELRLNHHVISSDVGDYSTHISRGEFERAADLYRGPFLDAVHIEKSPEFSRWQDVERAALERSYLDVLETLANAAESTGRHEESVKWWLRARSVDPLRARSVIGVMKSLDRTGDRAGALRHAQGHEALLRDELGAKADPDVAALAEQMRVSGSSGQPGADFENHTSAEAATPRRDAVAPAQRPGRRSGRWILAAGLAFTIAAAALIPGALNQPETKGVANTRRVVVAMFENQSGDSTLNPLSLVAADWMTRGITATPGVDMLFPGVLYVQGRKQSGVPTTAIELARNNGADLAISGSYYKSRDSLFFAATLIDVASGRVLRALGPFASNESEPLVGIESLRQGASVALESMLDARVSGFVSPSARVPNLDAYREFMRGEELHWRGDMAGALPHFAKAGQLDTAFLLVAGRMSITAVNAGRCDVVDSIAAAADLRRSRFSESEMLWVRSSQARCNGDMEEAVRHGRAQLALDPGQPLFKWALSATMRRANRPAEAARLLSDFDVEHDLGWLVGPMRLSYWRELLNAQHAISNHEAEWKSADRMTRESATPLMGYFYKARSFAGKKDARSAVRMVDSISGLPGEQVAVGAANFLRPIRAASTGWTMYGISEELLAHGYPTESRAIAERVIKWVESRTDAEKNEPEYRLILARANLMTGGNAKAYDLLEGLTRADSTNVEYRSALGRAAALRGDTATARRISLSLVPIPGVRDPVGVLGRNGVSARILGRAQIAAALGDKEGALALLNSLPSRVHPTDFLQLHSDPAFVPLHGDRRFKGFTRPIG